MNHFHIFAKNFGYFLNFRSYIQYHIHSIKAHLHIRMNKKFKELEEKLSKTKIISDEYLSSLEVQNFYSTKQKKEDDMKLFVSDFTKVNI